MFTIKPLNLSENMRKYINDSMKKCVDNIPIPITSQRSLSSTDPRLLIFLAFIAGYQFNNLIKS